MSYAHNDQSSNRTDVQTIENLRNNAQDQVRQGEHQLQQITALFNNDQSRPDVIQSLENLRNNAQDQVRKGQIDLLHSNELLNSLGNTSYLRASASGESSPPRLNKNVSSWIHFGKQNRSKIKESQPDIKPKQMMRELASLWHRTSPEDRQPYEEIAKRDKERYLQEKTEAQR